MIDERFEALRKRIERLDVLMRAIEAPGSDGGSLAPAVVRRLRAIVDEATSHARRSLDQAVPQGWDGLPDAIAEVTGHLDRALNTVGAAFARVHDDDPSVEFAECLFDEVNELSPLPVWNSIALPSSRDLVDLRDGAIRVATGPSPLARAPIALHELGHVAGGRLSTITEVKGRSIVTLPHLERLLAVDGGLDQVFSHKQEFWADVYAVFVGGVAPLAAMAYFVFQPSARQTQSHPAPTRRVSVMTETLRLLHPNNDQVELPLQWIEAAWADTIRSAGREVDDPSRWADAARSIAAELVGDMQRCTPAAGYIDFQRAHTLANQLGTPGTHPDPSARMIDVVNAVWITRLAPALGAKVDEVESRALDLARALVQARSRGGGSRV